MNRTALTLSLLATATGSLAVPASSHAGVAIIKTCHNLQRTPPGLGRGWSEQKAGTAIYANAYPEVWANECSHVRNNSATWVGSGGHFGDTAAPGAQAFLRFTPPAGVRIEQFDAEQDLFVSSGAFAEAGVFTSTGRPLDSQAEYADGYGIAVQSQVRYYSDQLGADGSAGLMFGARCPTSLPPTAGDFCGGAGASYADVEIRLSDSVPSTVDAAVALDAAGKATLTWSGRDDQLGVQEVRVTRQGRATVVTSPPCSFTGAPVCQTTATGSTSDQLSPGETASYTVEVGSPGEPFSSKTVSVTRPPVVTPPATTPQPQPTPAPRPTPQPTPTPGPPGSTPPPAATSRVTLKTKAKRGGKLVLSGSAKGCSRVKVKPPKRGTKFASVKRGRWSLTVTRKKGVYTAICGDARAKRTAR